MVSTLSLQLLVASTILFGAVSSYDGHYMGGAMFFTVDKKTSTTSAYTFRVTALIARKVGYGPCGDNCTFKDLGQSTYLTSKHPVNSTTKDYFGQWLDAVIHSKGTTTRNNITDDVSQKYVGHVTMVNQRFGWEQEIGNFDVGVNKTASNEITFNGDFWQHTDYAKGENMTFTMASRLTPTRRGDTGQPNNSPLMLFQPLYRQDDMQLDTLDDKELFVWYRMPRHAILTLVDLVRPMLERPTQRSHPMSTETQVLVTLRYLGKGGFMSEIGDLHGIAEASVSRAFHSTIDAFNSVLHNIKFPWSNQSQMKVQQAFYAVAGLPKVLGAIDGTLIPIKRPSSDQEMAFVCRKGYHALNVQAVCDANLRIALNNKTRFRLTTYDPDGDFVHCGVLKSIIGRGPQLLPGVRINRDCSVEVSPLTSDGYIDGGLGAIGINVKDYSIRPTSLLGEGRNTSTSNQKPLSNTPVQFMIQTVQDLNDPQFVDPTFDDGHEFIAYVGSVVAVPLYAKPHPASTIDIHSFYIRSIPFRKFSVALAKVDSSRKSDRVGYSTFTWRPQQSDVGYYIIGISTVDKNGQTGIERHYIMEVKDLPISILPNQDRPYFVFSPVGSTIRCLQDTTCSLSLYTTTNNSSRTIVSVSVDYTSLPGETGLSGVTKTMVKGQTIYQTDVAITSSLTGHQIVCFTAHDDHRDTSKTECVAVTLVPKDPCASEPCGSSVCKSDGDSYACICNYGFTGRQCETDLKECASSPCVHGTCRNNPLAVGRYMCRCDHGWNGTNCETSTGKSNITNSPSPMTSASTTPSAAACSDASNINCQTLEGLAGICSLSNRLPYTFCSRYCRLCHDVPSTTVPPPTTTVKPTLCTTCRRFQCILYSRVVSCPLTKPYCRTVVQNLDSGATSFSKSCASSDECKQNASGLTPHQADCDNFDPMKKYFHVFTCSYCCGSDNCNVGGRTVPKKETRVKIG